MPSVLMAAGLAGIGCGLAGAQERNPEKVLPPTGEQTPAQAPPTQQPELRVAPILGPVQSLNFRERPQYPADPQRMKRTVQIDGVLSDGEWEPFYTISAGAQKGTIYCHWDADFLYLAARADQPASVLFDIDAGGDGWLRGADNLEVIVGSVPEGAMPTVKARLLDAANSKETPLWNETATDVKTFLVAGKIINGTQVLELAIPKDTASLVLRGGASIGLRAELLPPGPATAYTPTQPFEPHLLLEANLVESRVLAAAGINPRLTISDEKCVPGQTLFATLELLNQTDQPVPVKSVLWEGTSNSKYAVNMVREVSVPPIPALKTLKRGYRTELPPNLAPGSYTLTATAEMEDGRQAQSAVTFTVVEPLQVQMNVEPEPVAVVGSTKLNVNVDVFSSVPKGLEGEIELRTIPEGWELVGKPRRRLIVFGQDKRKVVTFQVKIPSTTQAGDYPFEAELNWKGRTWKLKHVARVIRTDTPASASGN